MPITSGGMNFYNPQDFPTMPGFTGSQLYDWQAELNKRGHFANMLGQEGLLGMDNRSDLARSMYDRMNQGYEAWQISNPDAKWTDYANKFQGRFKELEMSMDPQSRGVNRSQYGGGASWLARSG